VTASPESLVKVKSGAKSPSATKRASSRRAVGVVRVSRVGGREGEAFVSPSEQAQRISDACKRDGLKLVDTFEELDVSGGAPLAQRPGLSRALELVESKDAEVVVVAYFDRLVRSVARQAEILERVENAGGSILAVDVGEVSSATASMWLSASMLGAVAEYHRRVTAERTQDAKRRAVERGIAPYPNVPPGYRRGTEGQLEPHPKQARVVAKAFRLRAEGATVMEVREHLRRNGIERSFHGTTSLLASRVVLGELRFGDLVNVDSHPAIVTPAVWQAVQAMRSPRGRRAKSDRLLARLGVLRCGSCGARMVVGTANHGAYALYRCPPIGDCTRRVTVSAELAETVLIDEVQRLLAGMKGTATVAKGAAEAERELERWERDLDGAVRAFAGFDDVDSTRERLLELRTARDEAKTRAQELRSATQPALTVTAGDWDLLDTDERRALIRAVIESAEVRPGRGRDRITVKPRG
jgi:DNA invertase Pin-like site-specific DNA recombinase